MLLATCLLSSYQNLVRSDGNNTTNYLFLQVLLRRLRGRASFTRDVGHAVWADAFRQKVKVTQLYV